MPTFATIHPHEAIITTPIDTGHAMQHGCDHSGACNMRVVLPFTDVIHTNARCVHNEVYSLVNRHLMTNEHRLYIADGSEIRVNHGEIDMVEAAYALLRADYPPRADLVPFTDLQVVASKPPSKRKLYHSAALSLRSDPQISPRDLRVKSFVKNERVANLDKPPRMIQAYNPRYTLELQKRLIPIDKWFKSMGYSRQMTTKAMDLAKQAQFLHNIWTSFDQPVALLMDHSRFDSRQHTAWLQAEIDYYCEFYPGDHHFRDLLTAQLTIQATTPHGLNYRCDGTRASGVPNTSLGNGLTNYAILSHFLRACHVERYRIVVNGDDSVVVIEQADEHRINHSMLDDYGFATTISHVYEFTDIDYCQTKPVCTIDGWVMIRDPLRVISRATVCIDPSVDTVEHFRTWLASVGDCESSLNAGVPVLQSFAHWLRSLSHKRVVIDGYDYKTRVGGHAEITPIARHTFWLAFGITPTRQVELERYFSSMPALSATCDHTQVPRTATSGIN